MSPKSYSDGCLNSTSSVRTEFLVGTSWPVQLSTPAKRDSSRALCTIEGIIISIPHPNLHEHDFRLERLAVSTFHGGSSPNTNQRHLAQMPKTRREQRDGEMNQHNALRMSAKDLDARTAARLSQIAVERSQRHTVPYGHV